MESQEVLAGMLEAGSRLLSPPSGMPRTDAVGLVLSIAALLLVAGPGSLIPFTVGPAFGALFGRRWRRAASTCCLLGVLAVAVLAGVMLFAWSFEVFDTASPVRVRTSEKGDA